MRCRNVLALSSALVLLAGCATTGGARPVVTSEIVPDKSWQGVILPPDSTRLAALPAAWGPALAAVRPRFAAALAKEGALLDPSVALDHVALPPGSYTCRVVKLGGPRRLPAYRTYPPFFCYVRGEGAALSFMKQTGDERPVGWLYPDGDTRYVFLGAYARGRVTPPSYGAPGARNALGTIERVAPFRWRLTLAPVDDSALLTVYEVTPVPLEQQAK
ncbi:DUF4893 domain-containing protein [Sphingomonas sp. Leaf357]|uniref:DUF4893 domain-containing protein n=1 Tax=Sphingomonas sp. Leaf357 TaxID=1736350 RepID=UPI0009E86E65|nr:DUF4893 domain-containing protein [Sphingomonas sp. Leaf357]